MIVLDSLKAPKVTTRSSSGMTRRQPLLVIDSTMTYVKRAKEIDARLRRRENVQRELKPLSPICSRPASSISSASHLYTAPRSSGANCLTKKC